MAPLKIHHATHRRCPPPTNARCLWRSAIGKGHLRAGQPMGPCDPMGPNDRGATGCPTERSVTRGRPEPAHVRGRGSINRPAQSGAWTASGFRPSTCAVHTHTHICNVSLHLWAAPPGILAAARLPAVGALFAAFLLSVALAARGGVLDGRVDVALAERPGALKACCCCCGLHLAA